MAKPVPDLMAALEESLRPRSTWVVKLTAPAGTFSGPYRTWAGEADDKVQARLKALEAIGTDWSVWRIDGPYVATRHVTALAEVLAEVEATLKHIQPYVGLVVQFLPDATRRVATAREKANSALALAPRETEAPK